MRSRLSRSVSSYDVVFKAIDSRESGEVKGAVFFYLPLVAAVQQKFHRLASKFQEFMACIQRLSLLIKAKKQQCSH